MNKEKFTKLPINTFNYNFYVYKIINDNNYWYEIIATKDDKEYYVGKLDYEKTNQYIKSFLLKDISVDLKQKYTNLNFKVLKAGIKVNDKIFRLKKHDNDFNNLYDLKIAIIQYIVDLKNQNILVM